MVREWILPVGRFAEAAIDVRGRASRCPKDSNPLRATLPRRGRRNPTPKAATGAGGTATINPKRQTELRSGVTIAQGSEKALAAEGTRSTAARPHALERN